MLGIGIAGGSLPVGGVGGITGIVAQADLFAQAANVATTTLSAVPAGAAGTYRASFYLVETQVATTSSTLPQAFVSWTDNDTNQTPTAVLTNGSTANVVGTTSTAQAPNGQGIIQARPGTTIQFSTSGYASVGATAMQYAVHVKLEYLGA